MNIGVPRESRSHEHRVGLTPFGVARLRELGCEVLVQDEAGRDSHFTSEDYAGAGAAIVYQAEEIFGRADLVCKIGRLTTAETRLMRPGTGVIGFMHFAVMPAETIEAVEEAEATVIGYEVYDEVRTASELPAGWTDEQDGGHYRLRESGGETLFGYAVGPHSWKRYLQPPSRVLWRARGVDCGFVAET